MRILLFFAVCTWHVARGNIVVPRPIAKIPHQITKADLHSNDAFIMNDAVKTMSENQMRVALEIYQAAANLKPGFFAVSTADVFIGLAQLHSGATGQSRQQLSNVLDYYPDSYLAKYGLQNLVWRLNSLEIHGVSLNTQMFHAYPSNVKDSFIEDMDITYRSVPQRVPLWKDLANGKAINEWSEQVDFPHSRRIGAKLFEGKNHLVLANAATYWLDFDLDDPSACYVKAPFHYNNKHDVQNHEYVKISAKMNYGELKYKGDLEDVATAQYIQLGYENEEENKIKTIIVLPNEKDDIAVLEKNLDEAAIREIISNTNEQTITAILPRLIDIENAGSLDETLKNMKLTEIFKETKDFLKITKTETATVGPFIHQTEIHHGWKFDLDNCKPNKKQDDGTSKTFTADHAFIVLNVLKDDNPVILSMARHGWVPNVDNAETGLFDS